jgi:hypothetical protein
MSIHLSHWDTPGSPQKEGKKMKAKKVTAIDKMMFVQEIITCDVFTSKDVEAVAILQQLVNDAKKEIATEFVNKQDAEARKVGKMVANKKEAIKTAASKLSFDEDTIYGAYARELGVQL